MELKIYDNGWMKAMDVIHKEKTTEELLYEEGREGCDVSLGNVMFEMPIHHPKELLNGLGSCGAEDAKHSEERSPWQWSLETDHG